MASKHDVKQSLQKTTKMSQPQPIPPNSTYLCYWEYSNDWDGFGSGQYLNLGEESPAGYKPPSVLDHCVPFYNIYCHIPTNARDCIDDCEDMFTDGNWKPLWCFAEPCADIDDLEFPRIGVWYIDTDLFDINANYYDPEANRNQ